MRSAPFPFVWAKAVGASELGRRERLVCFALMAHMNVKGICRPTVATLSAFSGYGQRSVFGALHELERLGWITRSDGRTGRATVYAGLIPLHSRVHTTPALQSAHQEYKKSKELSGGEDFGGF